MTIERRKVLAGLSGLGVGAAVPAWAQFGSAIRPQSDPWAQVDPYADPRNGFARPEQNRGPGVEQRSPQDGVFSSDGVAPALPGDYPFEDIQIGLGRAELRETINDMGGLHPGKDVQGAMQAFSQPLLAAAARQNLEWETFVPASRGINAFAANGGKLFFLPGLIAVCDHPAELAAIVAHEIGHIDYDHSGRRIQLDQMVKTAMAKAGGSIDPNLAAAALGGTAKQALMRGWGRENEYEADAHSLVILSRVGMDPAKASAPFHKFLRTEPPDRETTLFSTHPGTIERIRRLDQAAVAYRRPVAEFIPPGWQTLKAAFPTPAQFRNS